MAKFTSRLDGFDATKRALKAAPELVRVLGADAIAKSTFAVEQTARALAPQQTGALRQAITSKSSGLSGRVGIAGGIINGRRPEVYWRFVEYGTVRMPARSMFRAAAEREAPIYIKRLQDIGPKLERDLSSGRFA